MGDFNDWFAFRPVRRTLARVLPESTNLRSFPACWPLLRLDRLYCSRPGMLVSSFTDPEGRHASDHLPVIADLDLRPPLAPPPAFVRPEQASRRGVDLVEQGERP